MIETYVYDPAKGANSTVSSIIPVNTSISGQVRFPEDSWLEIRKGLKVKGGGMSFEADRIYLQPDTKVAKSK